MTDRKVALPDFPPLKDDGRWRPETWSWLQAIDRQFFGAKDFGQTLSGTVTPEAARTALELTSTAITEPEDLPVSTAQAEADQALQDAIDAVSAAAVTTFQGLTDASNYVVGDALKVVRVNAGGTGLDFGVVLGTMAVETATNYYTKTAADLLLAAKLNSSAVSAFMLTVLDDTTAGAALTTLGLSANAQTLVGHTFAQMRADLDVEAGTDFYSITAADAAFQPKDATLTAAAALAWTAGTQVLTLTAADTFTLKTVGQAAGNVLDKAAGDALYQAAGSYQASDATLTALAGVTTAADKLIYATGVDAFSTTDFGSVARTFVNQTTQALMRTTGLGMSSDGSTLVTLTNANIRAQLGLATVATSGSASDLTTGTLPVAQTAALTGEVTKAAGASATTIDKTLTYTWTGPHTFSTTASGVVTTFISTDASATVGPRLSLDRQSASPAAADFLGSLLFVGRDSAANSTNYAALNVILDDPTDGSEDAHFQFVNLIAGTNSIRWNIGNGVYYNLGSDMGANTVNAVNYYNSGTKVVGNRVTGWTASTGTAARGAFATFAGQVISASPTQAQVQAIDDHVKVLSQQLKAMKDDLIAHGLIGT
jgi:hypothetical protein